MALKDTHKKTTLSSKIQYEFSMNTEVFKVYAKTSNS